MWLDGADPAGTGVVPASGTLATWADKSGSGNNATQSTSANQPTYSSNGLVFAGSQWYQTPITSFPTAESIFIVFRTTLGAANIFAGTTGSSREAILYTGNKIYLGRYGTDPSSSTPNAGVISLNTNILYSYQYTSSAVTFNVNGSTTGSGTPAFTYSGTGTSWIGSSGYAPVNMNGTIYEFIYYNSSINTTQRQTVESYLAQKWGLTSSLPVGHPGLTTTVYGTVAAPTVRQKIRVLPPPAPLVSYTQAFAYTGANQTFAVPSRTTSITVYMWGAGGGGGYSSAGGAGAYIQGILTVTPGSSIIIIVGGAGLTNSRVQTYGGGGGATNTGNTCGSGGGRSAIQFTAGTDVVTVAGGGGGGYYGSNGTGGAGDATTGTGANGSPSATTNGGKGGSQSAGGAAGSDQWSGNPTAGGQYYGGEGSTYSGSGGGGGYYGGGGGGAGQPIGGGGGGGSSLTTALASFLGYNSSDSVSSPYNGTYNPSGIYGAAAPGANLNGNPGHIVLVYMA